MKNKLTAVLVGLAGMLFAATSSNAAPVVTIFAGSSGALASFAIATGASAVCGNGPNHWSQGSTANNGGVDARAAIDPQIPLERGTMFVAYDGAADGSTVTHICVFLSVDSVVGNRLFFGVNGANHGSIQMTGGLVQGNKIPGYLDNVTPLPAVIAGDINGQQITAAVSDIRPEDAQFASIRTYSSLGYGPLGPVANVGTPVCSNFSTGSAQVVLYNISGTDPISSSAVPQYATINVGAYPVVFAGNTTGAAAGDLGSLKANANVVFGNIGSHTIATVMNGTVDRTIDLVSFKGNGVEYAVGGGYVGGGAVSPVAGNGLHVLTREPISGTYNTVEFQTVQNKGTSLKQEDPYVAPVAQNAGCPGPHAAPFGNPASAAIGVGTWGRVIGTGEMLSTLAGTNNAFGYAFWTFAAWAGAPVANTAYFSVDGTDPFFASYSANPVAPGVVPSLAGNCGGALPCLLPFTHIKDGSYRVWNIIRVITSPAQAAGNVGTFVQNAQDQANTQIGDFVPFTITNGTVQNLSVFRSHYTAPNNPAAICVAGQNVNSPVNGALPAGATTCPEGGGDVAGAVFTWQNDLDSFIDTGHGEILGFIQ